MQYATKGVLERSSRQSLQPAHSLKLFNSSPESPHGGDGGGAGAGARQVTWGLTNGPQGAPGLAIGSDTVVEDATIEARGAGDTDTSQAAAAQGPCDHEWPDAYAGKLGGETFERATTALGRRRAAALEGWEQVQQDRSVNLTMPGPVDGLALHGMQ